MVESTLSGQSEQKVATSMSLFNRTDETILSGHMQSFKELS